MSYAGNKQLHLPRKNTTNLILAKFFSKGNTFFPSIYKCNFFNVKKLCPNIKKLVFIILSLFAPSISQIYFVMVHTFSWNNQSAIQISILTRLTDFSLMINREKVKIHFSLNINMLTSISNGLTGWWIYVEKSK